MKNQVEQRVRHFVDFFFGVEFHDDIPIEIKSRRTHISSGGFYCAAKGFDVKEKHKIFAKSKGEMNLNRRERCFQRIYVNPK